MDYDEDFLSTFNEKYPLERYIFKEPVSLGLDFDDVQLIEIFVPKTEIRPIFHNGQHIGNTHVNPKEVYVKVKGPAGEMRFGYLDFNDGVRDTIRESFYEDFGDYFQYLYIDSEGDEEIEEEMTRILTDQYILNIEKYGSCEIKDTYASKFIKVQS